MGLELHAGLMAILKSRFEKYPVRHRDIEWAQVQARLESAPLKLKTLQAMEDSDGEPDVTGLDASTGEVIFTDCAAESPSGRRSLCYDQSALDSRKENKPSGSAAGMAATLGIQLLSEQDYRDLQELGEFDLKTSSWVETPQSIRKLGGALFCDRRYDHVFVYHNGAESYYGARGFRGQLRV